MLRLRLFGMLVIGKSQGRIEYAPKQFVGCVADAPFYRARHREPFVLHLGILHQHAVRCKNFQNMLERVEREKAAASATPADIRSAEGKE